MTRRIEDRLRNLNPQPMQLDAESVVSAAHRAAEENLSPDEPDVQKVAIKLSRQSALATTHRHWISLAAACVFGMMAGATLTAIAMRSGGGVATNTPREKGLAVDDDSVHRVTTPSQTPASPDDSGTMPTKFATDRGLAAEIPLDSMSTDYPLFQRNGLSYSLKQQQFIGTPDSFALANGNAGNSVFPTPGIATSEDAFSQRSADTGSLRRDRLMQELLQM